VQPIALSVFLFHACMRCLPGSGPVRVAAQGGMSLENILPGWLRIAGHDAVPQALLIIGGTFILEDATTVVTAMTVQTGAVGMVLALVSLYAGVALGDLGLYGLGYAAARSGLFRRWVPSVRVGRDWLQANLLKTVFVSRFLPGARLPTYTACGFLGANFTRFACVAVVATLVWTSLLFAVSLRIGQVLIDHLGPWRWVGMAGFALTMVFVGRFISRLRSAES
jgi:membrane protein DedA with SNARE-associated domain